MSKIVLFDPSYGTLNLGDEIINRSVTKQMEYLFDNSFLVRYGTHNPLLHIPQMLRMNDINNSCNKADLKFIGGTNIIKNNLMALNPGWNINLFTAKLYSNSICIGVGLASNNDNDKPNAYTRAIYNNVLSRKHIHSARDERTKCYLMKLGFKAVNTGCPTMWSLNKEFCKSIPQKKANNVVFTLTDYGKDNEKDQQLIDILNKNYEKVYFWIQGTEDLEYLKTMKNIQDIILVNPNLKAYKSLLDKGDIDYVGTRLHAGIYAMQHGIRSIILAIDNRARDMQSSYNINAIERSEIELLPAKLNSSFATEVHINEDAIKRWKIQFLPRTSV